MKLSSLKPGDRFRILHTKARGTLVSLASGSALADLEGVTTGEKGQYVERRLSIALETEVEREDS